ncbi:MAG: potassium channel family protein [Candidatus Ranarchaeia archaeon]
MGSHKSVKYEPRSVRELLIEMKNTSEIMIDLAYYSVLYNDQKIAKEVLELEEEVDKINYLLLMNAALAVRDKEDAEQTTGIIKIANASNKISDAAGDIAKIPLLGLGGHPSLHKAFSKTDEEVKQAIIFPESILVGQKLKELELGTTIGVDVIAIRRLGKVCIDPTGENDLLANDIVVVRGSNVGVKQFEELAEGKLEEIPK